MMWMGGGMGSMMFPTVHHYMSRMGLGMTSTMPHVPPVHASLPMSRLPFMNQSVASVSPAVNQAPLYASPTLAAQGFANQMPSMLGLNPMQLPHSQVDFPSNYIAPIFYQTLGTRSTIIVLQGCCK